MKNCYRFKSLISNYIDKEISFRDRKFFESHKESCNGCKKLFLSIATTREQMQTMSSVTVSDDFMESLRKKILNDRNSRILAEQNKTFSFRKVPAFAYGFSSVLILVIVGFVFMKMPTAENAVTTQMPIAVQDKIEDAKSFQQQFNATPGHLNTNLANTKVDSGKTKSSDKMVNFQNNLNTVDYQKK